MAATLRRGGDGPATPNLVVCPRAGITFPAYPGMQDEQRPPHRGLSVGESSDWTSPVPQNGSTTAPTSRRKPSTRRQASWHASACGRKESPGQQPLAPQTLREMTQPVE